MKSISQLCAELDQLKHENELLREDNRKLRANQPVYFRDDDVEWWLRRSVKQEGER